MTADNQLPSTFFFPLRTNVEYFQSPKGYLSLIERIKQASLLYENILFESGIYTAVVGRQGSQDFWFPPDQINEQMIGHLRADFINAQGNATLIAQAPNSEPIEIPTGEITRSFFCEFHTSLQSIEADKLPWIQIEPIKVTEHGKEAVRQVKSFLAPIEDSILDPNPYLKTKIIDNLSRDIVVSQALNAATSTNALYMPVLLKQTNASPAPGLDALSVALPDLTHLTWDEIAELREHDSLIQLRDKLISLEKLVRTTSPDDGIDEIKHQGSLEQAVIDALSIELANQIPTKDKVIRTVVLDLVSVPLPFSWVSTIVSAVEGMTEVDNMNRSWVAAYLKLRAK